MSDGPKLHKLPPPPSSVPCEDVVTGLKRWLARAEAGEIRGYVIVAATNDDTTMSGIQSGDCNRHFLLSAMELGKARLIDWINSKSFDCPDPTEPEKSEEPAAEE